MKNRCEIRIYDSDFNWVGVVTGATSVQFRRELYIPGSFEIHIHPESRGTEELIRRNNIIVINGDKHKSGFITDFILEDGPNGAEYIIYGQTGQGFTKMRLTVPPSKEEDPDALGWDRVQGPAESVIKHYINRHLIATGDTKRHIPHMKIASDLQRGPSFPWRSRFHRLSDELNDICAHATMGYEIWADIVEKRWVADIIEGADRSGGSSDFAPITFNVKYQNMNSYRYAEDYQNYRTTGYAGGYGEDENRLIYTVGPEYGGIDRYEEFLDCGTAVDIDELKYYAGQKMAAFTPAKTLEAEALPKMFIFDRDFFLGDSVMVTIPRLNLSQKSHIMAVREIWEQERGYWADIRFGNKLPDLFSIMKRDETVR